MRIAIVSTFFGHCGIANYTRHLATALTGAGVEVEIIAEDVWRPSTLWYPLAIFAGICRSKPDVVHFQHEYLLFGKGEYGLLLLPLLALLRTFGKTIIITMHSVVPLNQLTPNLFEEYTRRKHFSQLKKIGVFALTKCLSILSQRMIVHTETARSILLEDYDVSPGKVTTVFHGATVRPSAAMRAKDDDLVLCVGFVKPSKGIETLLRAMKDVCVNHPKVRLLIAGEAPENCATGLAYSQHLVEISKDLGISNNVTFDFRFVPEDELDALIASANIVVLPYRDMVHGESGVLKRVASFGKPVVVSDAPKFMGVLEDRKNALFFPVDDSKHLAGCIERLLMDPLLAATLSSNLKVLAMKQSWRNVALKMWETYSEVKGEGREIWAPALPFETEPAFEVDYPERLSDEWLTTSNIGIVGARAGSNFKSEIDRTRFNDYVPDFDDTQHLSRDTVLSTVILKQNPRPKRKSIGVDE